MFNDGVPRTRADAGWLDAELLASLELHELVPAPLAAWRPLVVDGIRFFLEHLPPERLAAIVATQLTLDEGAPAEERVVALLAQCPTLHKLGQVLARNRRLHPALRARLQALESMPAATPPAELAARIREELGEALPLTLGAAPLAEGSVAVVLPFSWTEDGRTRHGVFKVLKPGIEARLGEELAVLAQLEDFLERRSRELGLPALEYRDTLGSVRTLLAQEIRLDVEQKNLRAAAAFHADDAEVFVPQPLPWCSPRVTAMERVFGTKVSDAALAPRQRRRLADAMVRALLAQPFWSDAAEAVFHGDLHGGNLFVTDDGRLAVLDWSLTARLSKRQRETLVDIALGGLALDAAAVRDAVASLGSLPADDPLLADTVERAIDRLALGTRRPGFDWLLELLDELALRVATGFRQDFALLRKSWLSLSGLIHDLVEDASPDAGLLGLGLQRFIEEWPARLLASPYSHRFSTHVSNAGLWHLSASAWPIALRYWTRRWRQILDPAGEAQGAGGRR